MIDWNKLFSNANVQKQVNILNKNETFQQYSKNKRKIPDFENVDKEAAELSEIIQNWKEKDFCDIPLKLNHPQTSPKTYWSIIKSCYNGRKIPIIPPLSVNGKIITNFKEKANLLTNIFRLNLILYQMTVI